MSSILDINFDDVYEPKTKEADTEVRLRITNAILGAKKDDEDAKRLEITFTDPADDEFKDFTVYMPIPKAGMDKKKANNMKLRLKDFYACFGVEPRSLVEDMIGKQGWVIVGLQDDPDYGKKNTVKRYIISH